MLSQFSNQLADVVDAAAPSVVQVHGRRRPASGLVYGPGIVATTMRAIGRDDNLQVRGPDGRVLAAEFAGWDVATTLAVLRVPELDAPPATLASAPPRVGHIAVAVARSWSNATTASTGIVSVVGGPLRTSRHHAIETVIRTTAPMHDGFSGGAFVDVEGRLIGVTTASAIRGLGVVIPASIAWKAVAHVLERGAGSKAYLGVSTQVAHLPGHQLTDKSRERAVLVLGVASDSPAARAGILVGDVILSLGDRNVEVPEDVLEVMSRVTPGSDAILRVLRGGIVTDVSVTVGERPVV